ncbi:hypothetical protein APED_00125 [Acanthopleuribacter pedis]
MPVNRIPCRRIIRQPTDRFCEGTGVDSHCYGKLGQSSTKDGDGNMLLFLIAAWLSDPVELRFSGGSFQLPESLELVSIPENESLLMAAAPRNGGECTLTLLRMNLLVTDLDQVWQHYKNGLAEDLGAIHVLAEASVTDDGGMPVLTAEVGAEMEGQPMRLLFFFTAQSADTYVLMAIGSESCVLAAKPAFKQVRSGLRFENPAHLDRTVALLQTLSKKDMDPEQIRVKLLGGADVNGFHPKYGTPLMRAVVCGNPYMVKSLLEAGADPNKIVDGLGPFEHVVIARPSIAALRDIYRKVPAGDATEPTLIDILKDLDQQLRLGILWGRVATVRSALQRGASLETKDEEGRDVRTILNETMTEFKALELDTTAYQEIKRMLDDHGRQK